MGETVLRQAAVIGGDDIVPVLREAGFDTIVVSGEDWSEQKFDKDMLDVVVIDEKMVNGNSWCLCSDIRKGLTVPIVMVGESDTESSWVKAEIYGVDYYAKRPIQIKEMVARIRSLLRRHAIGV